MHGCTFQRRLPGDAGMRVWSKFSCLQTATATHLSDKGHLASSRGTRLWGSSKNGHQNQTKERHTPASLYTQFTATLPTETWSFRCPALRTCVLLGQAHCSTSGCSVPPQNCSNCYPLHHAHTLTCSRQCHADPLSPPCSKAGAEAPYGALTHADGMGDRVGRSPALSGISTRATLQVEYPTG